MHSSPSAGRKRYGQGTPRERHNDPGSLSSDAGESSEPQGAGQALQDQPEDRRQVKEAGRHRRFTHRSQGREIDHAVGRGGIGDQGILPAHAASAGRLPLCPAGKHSAPDAFITAPLPPTPRHLVAAEGRGRRAH